MNQAEHMEQIFDRYVAARFDSVANKAYYDFWCDRVLSQVRPEARSGVFLELMCGTGELITRFDAPPGVRKLGIDLTHRMLSYGASRHGVVGQFVCGDARRLPLADASIRTIVIQGGLHHVAHDLLTVIAEIGRVLTPGGILVCTEPCDDHWAVRSIRRIVYRCFKIFDAESESGLRRSELSAAFQAAGLTLEEFQPFGYVGYALIGNTDVLGLCRNLQWPPAVRFLVWLDAVLQRLPVLSRLAWLCILRARKTDPTLRKVARVGSEPGCEVSRLPMRPTQ